MKYRLFLFCFLLLAWVVGKATNTVLLDSAKRLNNLGVKYYLAGDYLSAANYYKKSLAVKEQIYNFKNESVANSMNNLGLVFHKFWELDSAIVLLSEAEKIYFREGSDVGKIANANSNIGQIKIAQGEYDLATMYLKRSLHLLEENDSKEIVERRVEALINLSELSLQVSDVKASKQYLEQALKHANNVTVSTKGYMYNGLAYTYFLLNDSINCFMYLREYQKIVSSGSGESAYLKSIIFRDYGEYYTGFNNLSKAYYYLSKAEKMFESNPISPDEKAFLHECQAKLFSLKGNYSTSLKYIQKAISQYSEKQVSINTFENPNAEHIKAKMPVLQLLELKIGYLGELYNKTQDFKYLASQLQSSELAVELIESIRLSYQSYESKIFLAENENKFFTTAIQNALEAYQKTQEEKYIHMAFLFAEKSKSAILLSSLRESKAMSYGGIPDSILKKEKQLNRNISFYKEQIYEEKLLAEPDTIKLTTWQDYLYKSTKEYGVLIHFIEENYPDYYKLKQDTRVATVKNIQDLIDHNSVVIEYVLLDSTLLTFVISKNKIDLLSQKLDDGFYSETQTYLNSFRYFDYFAQNDSSFNAFCANSHKVYNYLLKSALEKVDVSKLIIINDGFLSYLPFEPLLINLNQTKQKVNYQELNYVLKHYDIYYAYSSTILSEVSKRQAKNRKTKLLAIAPEYAAKSTLDQVSEFITRQRYRKNLLPIPGALEEIEKIKKIISTDLLSGADATEKKFKEIASDYDLLHLAMHTVIDDENPMYSKLIFSSSIDSINDGYLNTDEIFGLKLNSRLTVLSSCSTGEGKINKGEGVISLARGFIYAGCPSLVMTLWEVEDKSGVVLMKHFYTNLLRGQSKSMALRNAKLKYLEESPAHKTHPFFWSTYICMGNNSNIYRKQSNYYLYGLILAGILLGGIVLLRRKRKG